MLEAPVPKQKCKSSRLLHDHHSKPDEHKQSWMNSIYPNGPTQLRMMNNPVCQVTPRGCHRSEDHADDRELISGTHSKSKYVRGDVVATVCESDERYSQQLTKAMEALARFATSRMQ